MTLELTVLKVVVHKDTKKKQMGKYIVAMANQFIDSRLHKNQNTARQDLLHRFWIRPDK